MQTRTGECLLNPPLEFSNWSGRAAVTSRNSRLIEPTDFQNWSGRAAVTSRNSRLIEPTDFQFGAGLERAMGIEPTSKAWEALILPMNYARLILKQVQNAGLIVAVKPCHSQRDFFLDFPEIELNGLSGDIGAVESCLSVLLIFLRGGVICRLII